MSSSEVSLADALFLSHMNGVMEERLRIIKMFEDMDSTCADWAAYKLKEVTE